MTKTAYILLLSVVLTASAGKAQISIGTSIPDASSVLELYSNNKGLLLPRVTLSNNLSNADPVEAPSSGLLVFNTGTNQPIGFYYWTGISWNLIGSGISDPVSHSGSSTDKAIARFQGTSGNIIQNSPVILSDEGHVSGVNQLTSMGLRITENPTANHQLVSDATGAGSWQAALPVDVRKNDTLIVAHANTLNFSPGINVKDAGNSEAHVTFFKNNVAHHIIQLSSSDETDLNTDTPTAINWNTEHYKDESTFIHSNETNPSRLYVRVNGVYEVNYMFSCFNLETTRVTIKTQLRKNGHENISHSTSYVFAYHINNDWVSRTSTSFLIQLEADDYIELVTSRQTNSGELLLLPDENILFLQLVKKL